MDEFLDDAGFTIISDDQAEWALTKIAEAKAEFDRLALACDAQISRYAYKKMELQKKFDQERAYFVNLLNGYFQSVPHKSTKTQETYALPSGRLVLKKEKLDFAHDDDVLLPFLQCNGFNNFVKVERRPMWGEFKKRLRIVDGEARTDFGEAVEGVTVELKPATFDVEVSE